MLKPYDLLENVLIDIEKNLKEGINPEILASKYGLSEGHLRRLFRFAFKQAASGYIRSRTLASSLEDLLKTEKNILNIAIDYGFGYEQSYIRAFKREFGLSPGELRKTRSIVKVKPPLHLFDKNKISGGVLFGPDFVMVPAFHMIGKPGIVPFAESVSLAPKMAKEFWHNERSLIKEIIDPNVYIGFTGKINHEAGHSEYMPAVMVKNLKKIPSGLRGCTFESTLCARFRYIGQHHYYDINADRARAMYEAICSYEHDESCPSITGKFSLQADRIFFEKIDIGKYDGTYCQMEWFSPVTEK